MLHLMTYFGAVMLIQGTVCMCETRFSLISPLPVNLVTTFHQYMCDVHYSENKETKHAWENGMLWVSIPICQSICINEVCIINKFDSRGTLTTRLTLQNADIWPSPEFFSKDTEEVSLFWEDQTTF